MIKSEIKINPTTVKNETSSDQVKSTTTSEAQTATLTQSITPSQPKSVSASPVKTDIPKQSKPEKISKAKKGVIKSQVKNENQIKSEIRKIKQPKKDIRKVCDLIYLSKVLLTSNC